MQDAASLASASDHLVTGREFVHQSQFLRLAAEPGFAGGDLFHVELRAAALHERAELRVDVLQFLAQRRQGRSAKIALEVQQVDAGFGFRPFAGP